MKRTAKKTKKIPALALAALSVLAASGCVKKNNEDFLNDIVSRENYDSVYGKIGTRVQVDMVTEKQDGRAYVTVDGVEYELGMDFLSMAMVYNTEPVGEYQTAEEVYN